MENTRSKTVLILMFVSYTDLQIDIYIYTDIHILIYIY